MLILLGEHARARQKRPVWARFQPARTHWKLLDITRATLTRNAAQAGYGGSCSSYEEAQTMEKCLANVVKAVGTP
jgi:hypothetical protein